jgi:type IV secretion system protein VirD4
METVFGAKTALIAMSPWLVACLSGFALVSMWDLIGDPLAAWSGEVLVTAVDALRHVHSSGTGKLALGVAGPVLWFTGGLLLGTSLGGPIHLARAARSGQGWKTAKDKTHGSARWGTVSDALKAGHLHRRGATKGIALGRLMMHPGRALDPRYRVEYHAITCAPTRAGKGIGAVIPNLLQYEGSAIVLDIKGENYAVTAAQRRRLGHEICVLDPFGLTDASCQSINWLDFVEATAPESISEAAMLAEAMVVCSQGMDSHWDEKAHEIIQALILHVATLEPARRHLGTVRELLAQPEPGATAMWTSLQESAAGYGVVARVAATVLGMEEREQSSCLSTAKRHTRFLDDPRIVESLRHSTVDLLALKHRPMTVYVVMPPSKIDTYRRYLRGVLGAALRAVEARKGRAEHPVLFLLDEVAQLGYMPHLEKAVSYIAGYGALLWFVVQDLSQIQSVYRTKHESILNNAVMHAYAPNDVKTAEYLEKLLGRTTVEVHSQSKSRNRSGMGASSNIGRQGRSLLTADEIRRLPPDEVLVFERGQPPQRLKRLNYLADPEYQGLAAPNPMYAAPDVETKGGHRRPPAAEEGDRRPVGKGHSLFLAGK